MGQYNLNLEELEKEIEGFMQSTKGDFELKDWIKISKKVWKKLTTGIQPR